MPGCMTSPLDTSPNSISDQPPILVTYNRTMHSINSGLYQCVFRECLAKILEVAPQTILGKTMSNRAHHQFSCYLINCKSTKLAMDGRIQMLVLTMLFQCGGMYGTVSVSPCVPFNIHSNLRHSRRTLKNLHIYPENALFALFQFTKSGNTHLQL